MTTEHFMTRSTADATHHALVEDLRPLAATLVQRVMEVVPEVDIDVSGRTVDRLSVAVALAAQALDEPRQLQDMVREWAPHLHGVGLEPSHLKQLAGEIAGLVAALATESRVSTDTDQWSRAASTMVETIAAEITAPSTDTSLATDVRGDDLTKTLASDVDELDQRTQAQAVVLQEIQRSLVALHRTMALGAPTTAAAPRPVVNTDAQAEEGDHGIASALAALNAVRGNSRKIARIVDAIDEVAFQTRLLTLNAAVQAARAGNRDLGLAVVVAQGRGLAQRSDEAAAELRGLVDDSVDRASDAIARLTATGSLGNEWSDF